MIRRTGCAIGEASMESLTTGTMAGDGTFRCEQCGFVLTTAATDALPPCPECAGVNFARASLFSTGAVTVSPDASAGLRAAALDEHAREAVGTPGPYLAWEERGEVRIVPITAEKPMRLGRSLSADVRFDDATVSRRHALIVRDGEGARVLDDRSLNGVFVNAARVTSHVLQDGDEVLIGRYHLRFLMVSASSVAQTSAG
jgi:phage FluMu protein Com